jgi:TetR/AcrR family transcriptional repressor for divergent bdcA
VSGAGRPREFDYERALRVALELFWEHGYDGTSLSRLREGIGISSASFYAAFGSKEGLFALVLDHYNEDYGRVLDSLEDPSLSPREAIEMALRASVRMQTDQAHPAGCLYALSVSTCVPRDSDAYTLVQGRRDGDRRRLASCIRRGVKLGELDPATNVKALAAAFHATLLGISTLARDGVPRAALDAAVTGAMGAWDAAAVPGAVVA